MKKRTPQDGQAAMADGVDHLLRQYKHLGTKAGEFGTWSSTVDRGSGAALDVTLVVASSEAEASIRDTADYVCDGVADEVEINAAFTQLQQSGGGVITLSEGGFYCATPVNLFSGSVALKGAGSTTTWVVSTADVSNEVALLYANGNISYISDLTVYVGNNGYNYAVYVHGNSGERTVIERVTGTQKGTTGDTYAAFGIGSYVHATDLWVPATNKGDGIYFSGTSQSKISSCSIWGADATGSGSGIGIRLLGTSGKDVIVTENHVQGCSSKGISIESDDSVIVANHVDDGIYIESSADGTIIGLNHGTVTDGGTNTQDITSLSSVLTTKGDLWGFDTADNRLPVGADGTIPVADSSEALGIKYDTQAGIETEVWGMPGAVTTGTGTTRLYAPVGMTIIDFRISLSAGTATVDAHKDGTTLFTTQGNRPVISSGNVSSLAIPDVTSVAADSYITIDVDAASSAEDLIVTMRWRKT